MGYEGDGMSTGILTIMAASRGPVGAVGTGIARGTCRHFTAWARERRNGRRPIDEPRIQMFIADMMATIQESRGLVINHSLAGDAVFGALLINPMMKAIFLLPREIRISRPYQAFLQTRYGKSMAARLRDRLDQARSQAKWLSEHRQQAISPLMLIDTLTRQLDDQSWLQGLELKGRHLTLRGISSSPAALLETLEASRLLRDVKFQAAITRDSRAQGDRFNISARLERPPWENGT